MGLRDLVSTPTKILVVDDDPRNVRLLAHLLTTKGYAVVTATSGPEALVKVKAERPDLVLLDVVMPEMTGYEVCQKIREDLATEILPVVMVTALDPAQERVKGLEAGADDFLTKPINQLELLARVRSLLRIKELYDTVQTQAAQLAQWNKTLEERVAEQIGELERISRLKRFFSHQLAELIVSSGDDKFLESHRREITVVFCDLRGFTAFAESAEPEEVMTVLREYHAAIGPLIFQFEGTLERFAGDGLMVFFNDPLPCPDPAARAVRMALAMRGRVGELGETWQKRGHRLDFGVGIALGYATLGKIGFEGRFDYGAIGTVTNLAARLCDEARGGQILVSQRVYAEVEGQVEVEHLGEFTLKGFRRPITAVNILRRKE
jgi:adenylate cyclase